MIEVFAKLSEKNSQKYFQTLRGHTVDALKILKAYMESNQNVIEQFCERWQLDEESFLRGLFITVYLHDIGKLTSEFQRNIRDGKSSQKYPHAFYALFVLNEIDFPSLFDAPIEKAAIMGHHTQLYSQLYEGEERFDKPSFLEEEIKAFISASKESYNELGFDRWFSFDGLKINPLPESRKFWGLLAKYRDDVITDTSLFEDKEKLKSVFSYVFSILKTCDDYSSAEFSEFIVDYSGEDTVFDSVMREPEKYTPRLYVESPYEKILDKNHPYEYQKDEVGKLCGDVPFYGMLFAPCGRGKTETALIWALKAMMKYRRNKIVFAMPTQITSNAMWERLCELFGEGKTEKERVERGKRYVGLFHGKSFIKLKSEKEREKGEENDLTSEDLDEIRGESFKGNVFFKPVTVTTIDHLIYSFVHGFSQADFALGNLQNAVVIFDEVHYYEKQTLEHIITLLKLFKKMQIPNLLMSGTLPGFFIEKVKEINSDYSRPYTDDEGLNFEPFKIKLLPEEKLVSEDWVNEKAITEIIKHYHKGLVQFIIVNTIERAKLIYETLIDCLPQSEDVSRIILLHSQFTYKDREEKERYIIQKLNIEKIRPFILIATQVIEISLDISCDVMYTELAPGDALGQRGGRLNRKGREFISKGFEHTMNVFMPEELDSNKKRPYEPILLEKTKENIANGACSYLKLKHLCDEVYSDYRLSTPTPLKNIFRECCLFGPSPYDINFGDEERGRLLTVRSDDIQKFDVIPWTYYEGDENNLTAENQAKVPVWWYKQDLKEHGTETCFEKVYKKSGRKERGYWVTRIFYSKEKGFDLKYDCPTQSII